MCLLIACAWRLLRRERVARSLSISFSTARRLLCHLPKGSNVGVLVLFDVEPRPLSRVSVHFILKSSDLVHVILHSTVVVRSPRIEIISASYSCTWFPFLLYGALLV